MYIFRWLMKHPLIILALYLLSIVAILFSMTGGGSSDKKADVTETLQTDIAEVNLSDAPAIEPSTLTSALVSGNTTDENESTSAETNESTETEVKVDSVLSNSGNTGTQADLVSQETATDTQFSEMSTDEMLLMAREAYWNNGLEESAEIYQQLINSSPDVIDYKGELGNVYWRQGFPKKAAELYAEISMPMIEAGNEARVANMVGFIGLFFPEKATEIHNRLQAGK